MEVYWIWNYKDYTYLKDRLIQSGFTIKGFIIEGMRGLFKAFNEFPIQMCQLPSKDDQGASFGSWSVSLSSASVS